MPIELTWMLPDRILFSRWAGEISVADMRVLVEELAIILDAADRPLHTVIDLSQMTSVGADAAEYYLSSPIPGHPQRGNIALVAASRDASALAHAFNQRAQRPLFLLFDTIPEARDFLLRHDPPPAPEDE